MMGMPKESRKPGGQEDLLLDAADAERLMSDVQKALNLLTDDKRDVLNCLFVQGMNAEEVEDSLGVGYTTVYRRRNKALEEFCYAFRGGQLLKKSNGA